MAEIGSLIVDYEKFSTDIRLCDDAISALLMSILREYPGDRRETDMADETRPTLFDARRFREVQCPACRHVYRLGISDRLDLPDACANCADIAARRNARREQMVSAVTDNARVDAMSETDPNAEQDERVRTIRRVVRNRYMERLDILTAPITFNQWIGDTEYGIRVVPVLGSGSLVPYDVRVEVYALVARSGQVIPRQQPQAQSWVPSDVDRASRSSGRSEQPKPIDIRARKIVLEDE